MTDITQRPISSLSRKINVSNNDLSFSGAHSSFGGRVMDCKPRDIVEVKKSTVYDCKPVVCEQKKPACPEPKPKCEPEPVCEDPCEKKKPCANWLWYLVWFFIVAIIVWFILFALKPTFVQTKDENSVPTGVIDNGKLLGVSVGIAVIVVILVALFKWVCGKKY